MKRIYIIIGVALLLFASCGRQQQAKSSVKDFVEQQLHRDVSYLEPRFLQCRQHSRHHRFADSDLAQ